MGTHISKIKERNRVNYNCPICKSTNKSPNLVGRFFPINEQQFKCNGCNSIFNKDIIYSLSMNNEV